MVHRRSSGTRQTKAVCVNNALFTLDTVGPRTEKTIASPA